VWGTGNVAPAKADRYLDSSLSAENWDWFLVVTGFVMRDETLGCLMGGSEADVSALLTEEVGSMLSGHWEEILLVIVEAS